MHTYIYSHSRYKYNNPLDNSHDCEPVWLLGIFNSATHTWVQISRQPRNHIVVVVVVRTRVAIIMHTRGRIYAVSPVATRACAGDVELQMPIWGYPELSECMCV
jgi:hypothetical protein